MEKLTILHVFHPPPPSISTPNPNAESLAPDPKKSSVTISPKQKEEQAQMEVKKLANAVHYIWETGEDKYMLRYFHTGFWHSCEKLHNGDGKRGFINKVISKIQCKWV